MSDTMEEEEEVVRVRPVHSTRTQWFPEADAVLIEFVRARPVLYDCRNPNYSDNQLKAALWMKIGRQLNTKPNLCKNRWNNIRDNYRKWLKRSHSGTRYKYSGALCFLDRCLVQKLTTVTTKREEGATVEDEDEEEPAPDTQADADTSYIKIDEDQSLQSEPLVAYDVLDESSISTPQYPARAQAVDAFLGALAPPLKDLSPYLLSLAKAEIFAVVHKYELKGLKNRGWGERDPLP